MERQYRIKLTSYDALLQQLEVLNKKAHKLGCVPVTLNVVNQETKTVKNEITGLSYTEVYNLVTITGETPKLAGWELIAAIEPQESGENLISCVPGKTVPVQYRTTNTNCDHCKTQRRRKEVFILQNVSGEFVQVGRNCISDFLGGQSPENLVASAEWGFSLNRLLNDSESESWGCCGGETTYALDHFVMLTAAVIRRLGWVSRSTAIEQQQEGSATVTTVKWLLANNFNAQDADSKKKFIQEHKIVLEDRDEKLALAALEWAKALPTDQGDYLYNLGVACRLGFVRIKTSGIVTSLIAAYQRHLDKESELHLKKQEEAKKVRQHLGTIGERTGFSAVKVVRVRSFDSNYGVKTLVNFETQEGSTIIWWASGDPGYEEGEVVDITASIVKHDDYKGIPQTVVQRVKEGLPKMKKAKSVSK